MTSNDLIATHDQLLTDTLRLVRRLLRNQQDCYGGSLCPGCDDVRRTVLATIDEVLGERVERRAERREERGR